ncbi:uncharacterized protein IWZ02DRAFT_435315 [Phyllosticta citriasiana]|uniref:uncharacterized protein n=1 Tax=Phyllosticta citriasiana TaxID=595635 RepID=UPI0030FD236D
MSRQAVLLLLLYACLPECLLGYMVGRYMWVGNGCQLLDEQQKPKAKGDSPPMPLLSLDIAGYAGEGRRTIEESERSCSEPKVHAGKKLHTQQSPKEAGRPKKQITVITFVEMHAGGNTVTVEKKQKYFDLKHFHSSPRQEPNPIADQTEKAKSVLRLSLTMESAVCRCQKSLCDERERKKQNAENRRVRSEKAQEAKGEATEGESRRSVHTEPPPPVTPIEP